MNNKIIAASVVTTLSLSAYAQSDTVSLSDYARQEIEVGADRTFTREESTAAVSIIHNKEINARSTKDIGNSLVGQGLGLFSKQGTGNYASANPTFYVRGIQSLSGNSPLVLVDGVERDIKSVSTEEVEEVQILKDAAALALYGYKGQNGAILVKTKRGDYNTRNKVKFTYDHTFQFMRRKPQFVDAYTYANAMNEARANDGLSAMYSDEALAAFRDGTYPYSYPNVNWADEVYGTTAMNNKFNLEFSGGSERFKYYALMGLISDKGFLKNANENDGYSTQAKYVRGNLRLNFDAKLTNTTTMKVNLLGILTESSRPGASTDLWDLIYTVPSAAFPIKTEDGQWGGNATWSGTKNPVAQSQGAAYSKNHQRTLFADMTLSQDLSSITPGLGLTARVAYDTYSQVHEDHSKTYVYGMAVPGAWQDGAPTTTDFTGGTDSEMGTSASTDDYAHLFHVNAGFSYDRTFGRHAVYGQLKWDYENKEDYGTNNVANRQDISLYAHYGYDRRYFADIALVTSASNRLAPGHKWSFSPTISGAWSISNEKFMKDVQWVDFLKLRASFGILNADNLPNDSWAYYLQNYSNTGTAYMFTNTYSSGGVGGTTIGRIATASPSHEKAYKYNIGVDATLFGGLDATIEYYWQHRTDIWVSSDGKYTDVLSFDKPYENAGVVDSHGFEIGLDYKHRFGKVDFNIGGNLSFADNKIKEQLEEPKLYDNLTTTGQRVGQIYGLRAIGFFKDQADIDNSPTQTFSTVRPGDIKYEDVNGDGKIDANDEVAIGYTTTCPGTTYNFQLGAEYKGLGIYMMFQGVGRYSAMLNAKSMFKPLVGNTTISEEYYNNRWTTENQDAKYPRLSSQSNANNYRNNTLFLADRSYFKLRDIEVYYNLPSSLLTKTGFIRAAKVYVKGIDLFCIDNIDVVDPENYGAVSPMSSSVVAGVSLTF